MSNIIRVLGISGSLRKASVNTALLRTAIDLLPEGMEIETFDIAPIPFYNGDVEAEGTPEPVRRLKERIQASDAIMIATPEYNYSVPGVLKNALDWASRPPRENPFAGKPAGIIGAGGARGTIRAQAHLRYICVELNMHVLNKPEIMIERPWEKFDQNGNLTDERTLDQLRAFMLEFKLWISRFK